MAESYVTHNDLVSFAGEKVNIPRDYLTEYRAQVKRLTDKIDALIEEHPDYNLAKVFESGSVPKGTALKTLNDMDVAIYVKKTEENPDEEKLLIWLMDLLKEAYKNVLNPDQFSKGTHCVRISFRGSGLDVDISPVIYDGDLKNKGYLINKDTGDRVLTSIPLHLAFIRKRKKSQPRHFRQVIRLLKWWNREKKKGDSDFKFKSFMIELICSHLLDNGCDMSDYPKAMEEFFLYIVKTGLKDRICFSDNYSISELPETRNHTIEIFDPVNPANNVACMYDENSRLKIIEAAHDALDAIHEAHYATTKSRAVDLWQQILGSTFKI